LKGKIGNKNMNTKMENPIYSYDAYIRYIMNMTPT